MFQFHSALIDFLFIKFFQSVSLGDFDCSRSTIPQQIINFWYFVLNSVKDIKLRLPFAFLPPNRPAFSLSTIHLKKSKTKHAAKTNSSSHVGNPATMDVVSQTKCSTNTFNDLLARLRRTSNIKIPQRAGKPE